MTRVLSMVILIVAPFAAPLAAEAQEHKPGKVPRVGLLTDESMSLAWAALPVEAFSKGLRDLGWVEGQNLTFERRYAEGKYEALPGLAAELVRLRVDVIVPFGTLATRAAKNATETIPIVFARVGDPVGSGLVHSLARPGGNLTGVSVLSVELGAKRLELLREALPGVTRVGVLWDPSFSPDAAELRQIEGAARSFGVRLQPVAVQGPEEFEGALLAMKRQRAGDVYVMGGLVFAEHRNRLAALAAKIRLPIMVWRRELVEAGGLLSYGPNFRDTYRRAAGYVDKVLKGAKPADLPVEQPTQLELVINLKTAKALGLTIPPSVLARADEVIQ
jgi:putative tryptophan/tyrosine transport system substrate-binding protein